MAAVQRWQQERIDLLGAMAQVAARDIAVLVELQPDSLAAMSACFGRRYDYLAPHRLHPALRAERVAGYAPAPDAEVCPLCWVNHGYATPLGVREALGRMDITVCPRCRFCELLPNGD